MDAQPLFVFGIARSGTNLLARALDAHPEVAVALDPYMPLFKTIRNATIASEAPAAFRDSVSPSAPFQDGYQTAEGYGLLDTLLAADLSAAIAQDELPGLRAAVAARAALEVPDLAAQVGSLGGTNCRELLASALDLVATCRANDATRWVGIKEVWVLDFLPAIARAFPGAKFLAIERDPRAVIASLAALAQGDPSQRAHSISYLRHWRKSSVLARRFADDPTLADRFYRVSYEDFVQHPSEMARRLAEFIDVRFDSRMLMPTDGGRNAWHGNSSYQTPVSGISDASLARWHDTLSDAAIRTIEFFCAPEMAMAGYRVTSDDPGALSGAVTKYVERADADPGSWRSDSGDPAVEIDFELRRQALLRQHDPATERDLVRRCFLFEDTYAAARAALVTEGAAGR